MTTATITADFTVTKFPERTLAYIRHTGPYMGDSALFERLFKKVMTWAGPKGLMNNPKMEAISVYHDSHEVPVEKQRISVGFTVPENTSGDSDIRIMKIPAGPYAVGTFELSPDEYGMAWEELFGFVQSKRLIPADGPMYESYKNDPHEHPDGKHLVDICVALKS